MLCVRVYFLDGWVLANDGLRRDRIRGTTTINVAPYNRPRQSELVHVAHAIRDAASSYVLPRGFTYLAENKFEVMGLVYPKQSEFHTCVLILSVVYRCIHGPWDCGMGHRPCTSIVYQNSCFLGEVYDSSRQAFRYMLSCTGPVT